MKKHIFFLTALVFMLSPVSYGMPSGYLTGSSSSGFPEYRFHTMPETSYYGGIQSIAKDSLGRMWFSGVDAVFMYDGTDFIRMDGRIRQVAGNKPLYYGKIAVDLSKELYLATSAGLMKYSYPNKTFTPVLNGKVTSMDTDEDGTIWFIRNGIIGSKDSGGTFREWPFGDDVFVSPKQVVVICNNRNVYVGSGNHLYRLEKASGKYALVSVIDQDKDCLVIDVLEYGNSLYVLTFMHGLFRLDMSGNTVGHFFLSDSYDDFSAMKELYLDDSGYMWILTQSGILLIEPDTWKSKLIQMDLHSSYSLPNNSVWTVYDDPDGGKWVGTYGGKLAFISPYDDGISNFKPIPGGLNHSIVSCFLEDEEGNLWIGTEGGGVNFFDRKKETFSYYTAENGCGLSSNMIKKLRKSPDGSLVVASFNGGMQKYDSLLDRFVGMGDYLPKVVYDFEFEDVNSVWLSNPESQLLFADLSKRTVEPVIPKDSLGKRVNVSVESLFHDCEGNLCLVSHKGLYIMDVGDRRILRHYIHDKDYNANNLCCHCVDSEGNIWLGSRGGGVSLLKNDGTYIGFRDSKGISLDERHVVGIVEDISSGNIWFSTDDGIFYYDIKDSLLVRSEIVGGGIGSINGAQYIRSCYRTSEGDLVFGGTDGFVIFSPWNVRKNEHLPRAFITGLKVNNKEVDFNYADNYVFTHTESNLEISFSSDNYLHPEKNRYAYRVIGGSSELWSILPAGQKAVQIFGIPPGRYCFELKAANNDGVWGTHEESFGFRVKPSPFMTWWAYLIYLSLLCSIIFLIFYIKKKLDFTKVELEELYEKKYIPGPSSIIVSSTDDEILKKAMILIETNMDNSAYDVDAFVSDMSMGRTSLYNKISGMTGMSIKEFILDIRLKRAAALLKESELTVSEISYMTGFSNPKYFSTCFKKCFGKSPSSYRVK